MQLALLLIASGFGYKIFAEATAHPKKRVKKLGQIVGLVMIVIGLGTSVLMISYGLKNGHFIGGRGGFWGGKMCPITGAPLMTEEK